MPEDPSEDRSNSQRTLHAQVTKHFAGQFSLEVDLHLTPGFTILFGPSGAGKTTLLDCIAGLATPDEGQISIGSRPLFDTPKRINIPISQRRVGYVLQSLALFPHMTVEQNVLYGISPFAARRA